MEFSSKPKNFTSSSSLPFRPNNNLNNHSNHRRGYIQFIISFSYFRLELSKKLIRTKVLLRQHLFFCLLFLCQLETTVKQTWLLIIKTNFSLILFKPSESKITKPF